MKGTRNIVLWGLLVLYSLGIMGCGKKTDVGTGVKADENKPVSEVKAEAEKMSTEDLRAAAMVYKKAIEAKTAEVDKLAKELMKVMLADKSSDEMKTLQAQTGKLNQSVAALTERFQIYYEKLKEKGGDLSGFEG